MNDNLKIIFPSGESVELYSALIGGRDDEFPDRNPTGCYSGPLDLDEIHNNLYYVNRSVIKLLSTEFGIPNELVDEYMLSALSEALTKEYNETVQGKSDIEIQKKIVRYGKNQN